MFVMKNLKNMGTSQLMKILIVLTTSHPISAGIKVDVKQIYKKLNHWSNK